MEIKNIKKQLKNIPVRFSGHFEHHPMRVLILTAFLLEAFIETLQRQSPLACAGYLALHPYLFAYNALILLSTLSLCLLFRRRTFVYILLTAAWAIVGTANGIMIGMRDLPLSAIDFGLLKSCFGIITIYLNFFQIGLILAGILCFLGLMAVLFRHCRKQKRSLGRSIGCVLALSLLLCVSTVFSLHVGALETTIPHLAGAYNDYGFVYCFSLSIVDRGVRRPADYSEEEMEEIVESIHGEDVFGEDAETAEDDRPNIIFVQLESFFDLKRLGTVSFAEDPLPVFTALKQNYPSGYLSVPAVGAGTANTEFEVLTGMTLEDFGAGEYPYKTILHDETCESAAYNLKALGYAAHAMHNNSGTFYDRNEIYPSLGFDTFTPLEYMQNVEYNPLGWAKDKVLTGEILKALNSTEERDFIFAVSVQPHGKYPDEEAEGGAYGAEDEDSGEKLPSFPVSGISDPALAAQYEYYAGQVYETDAFIGALTAALDAYEEPVILVLYGDHLPALSLHGEDLSDGSTLFQSEYVIWSNRADLPQDRLDLDASELSACALDYAVIHEGLILRLHQSYLRKEKDEDYRAALQMLEYDMLYGEHEAWDGKNPYLPTVMRMGTGPVRITGLYGPVGNEGICILGEGFTPFSIVTINGWRQEAIFFDSCTLLVPKAKPDAGDRVAVIFSGSDRVILGTAEEVIYDP
ncbi:MAG: sulfatase-like hydrolase/transferase [Clostridia bacterium]|nr:sulfatase-like hydrolase/transferase [Clostridia bacterium]